MTEESLSQPEAQMFERNIGHMAKREREVLVWVRGINDPKTGFVAGLDESSLQLCLTSNQGLSLIRRSDIVTIEETGNTLGTLVRSGIISQDVVDAIREKTEHFKRKATALYSRAPKK